MDAPKGATINVADDSFFPSVNWRENRQLEKKMDKLARSNFSIKVGTVIDRRHARAYINDAETDRVIYEYNPDKFFQNTPLFIQNSLQKNMKFGPQKEVVYVMDVTLKDAQVRITRGEFGTTRWGAYVVNLEIEVSVRDHGKVIMQPTPVSIHFKRPRKANKGRHPTVAQDRARMMRAIDEAFLPLAVEAAWKVRRGHLRRKGGDISPSPY